MKTFSIDSLATKVENKEFGLGDRIKDFLNGKSFYIVFTKNSQVGFFGPYKTKEAAELDMKDMSNSFNKAEVCHGLNEMNKKLREYNPYYDYPKDFKVLPSNA